MKKFKLKSRRYSFDHEGMIIQGERLWHPDDIYVYARDICKYNMDIMSKANIKQCMDKGNDFKWIYNLDELEPLEPIEVTFLDYKMLKFIQKQGAKYICRDKSGLIILCREEPYIIKNNCEWSVEGQCSYLGGFTKQLFQFVTWESQKYYIIKDVLENYEVVEDE